MYSQISFILLMIDICLNKLRERLTKITFVKTVCLSIFFWLISSTAYTITSAPCLCMWMYCVSIKVMHYSVIFLCTCISGIKQYHSCTYVCIFSLPFIVEVATKSFGISTRHGPEVIAP